MQSGWASVRAVRRCQNGRGQQACVTGTARVPTSYQPAAVLSARPLLRPSIVTPAISCLYLYPHHRSFLHTMDAAIPSISTAGVGSRFVSQNELDAAKTRRDEQWRAAYAR